MSPDDLAVAHDILHNGPALGDKPFITIQADGPLPEPEQKPITFGDLLICQLNVAFFRALTGSNLKSVQGQVVESDPPALPGPGGENAG
jgi:hypothetical protein